MEMLIYDLNSSYSYNSHIIHPCKRWTLKMEGEGVFDLIFFDYFSLELVGLLPCLDSIT